MVHQRVRRSKDSSLRETRDELWVLLHDVPQSTTVLGVVVPLTEFRRDPADPEQSRGSRISR